MKRDILRSVLNKLWEQLLPPISRQEYKRIDPGSEVIIVVQRGSKAHFHSVGHFWLMVILSEIDLGIPTDPAWFLQTMLSEKYTVCKEISREEFIRTVQFYDFVETEHDFSLHGQFQQAWLMYDVGTEIAILAETDCEFVVFSWELYD